MYLHFKFLGLLVLALLSLTEIKAQPYAVNITIAVAPPYYPHINDYINQPNKIMATLINTSNQTLSLYLLGSVSGTQGIHVYTDPAYHMPVPITLAAKGIYTMSQANLEQVFNADHLKYEGITKNELISGNGLPEGDYVICLRAYNYNSSLPVSADEPSGCSAPFVVTSVEPPVILQPVCGTEIVPATPQQVIFAWTRPPNSPVHTQFQLKIVEILPYDRDINDAIQSATHPVFLQKIVQVSNYLLGLADPALVEGKKYAFDVTAIDPVNRTVFRNNGVSEVCSFAYKKVVTEVRENNKNKKPESPNLAELQKQMNLIPPTVIKGRVLAKFPTNPEGAPTIQGQTTGTIKNQQNVQYPLPPAGGGGVNYATITNGSLWAQGNVNNNNNGYANPKIDDNFASPYLQKMAGEMLPVMNSQKFIFPQTENLNYTKPLPHTQVNLVVRVAKMNTGTFGVDMPSEYGQTYPLMDAIDLNGNYRQASFDVENIVLDSKYTDDQGNFTFEFQSPFYTGPCLAGNTQQDPLLTKPADPIAGLGQIMPGCTNWGYNPLIVQNLQPGTFTIPSSQVNPQTGQGAQLMSYQFAGNGIKGYICLKIEVENQKFCSPDIDIFAMPGDVIDLPTQVAKLKTYDLTVSVKSSDKKNQLAGANSPIPGVMVDIYRDTSKLKYEMPMILDYEGQRLKTTTYNSNGAFKDVASGLTDTSGRLVIKNLVRHDQIDPQYLISLRTRQSRLSETYYDFTMFNYDSVFRDVETNDNNKAVMKGIYRVIYNHEYTSPTQVTIPYTMQPLNPEIKGRVMMATNLQNAGMEGLSVYLYDQSQPGQTFPDMNAYSSSSWEERGVNTTASGFFRFINLNLKDSAGYLLGPWRRIDVHPAGYTRQVFPPVSEPPYHLLYGQLKDIKDVNLESMQTLTGYVEDEEGNSVPSYVKSTISPYYKTVKTSYPGIFREAFQVPVVPYGNNILTVCSLSSQYFSRDTTVSQLTNWAIQVRVVVYKRLHRPLIMVKDEQGNPVKEAAVEISGNYGVTDSKGSVRFRFPSADNQFILRIKPIGDFTPVQEAINNPVTPRDTTYTFTVKKAKSITGTITDKVTGNPINGGKVYSELKSTDGVQLYLSATSDILGKYTLFGIPVSMSKITVHVVKEGSNPTYAGVVRDLNLNMSIKAGTQVTYDFVLQPLTGWNLADIWGFPVAIESFKQNITPPGQPLSAHISGYFHDPPGINGFTMLKSDQKMPFQDMIIVMNDQGKCEPLNPAVTLDVLEVPVNIQNTFTGHLFNKVSSEPGYNIYPGLPNNVLSPVILTKTGFPQDAAGIRGQVEMDLNSFKIANDFHGILYMGDDTLSGKAVAFANKTIPGTGEKHNIFSLGTSLQPIPIAGYRVFNFKADADLGLSVLQGTEVRLRTILHTAIPGCSNCSPLDLKIRAGDLVISGTKITFEASPSEKLNFDLEKWKVISQKPWSWDVNEESIVLPEVLIITTPKQGVNAKVLNMKVRPNSLSEGTIDLTGGLTLGGIADLVLSGSLKPIFNFDQGIGHYRISVVGQTDQPAGRVYNLPNTNPSTLEFKSIGMFSNGDQVESLGQHFRFFDIIDMYVDQIMTGDGYFMLNGTPVMGMPGEVLYSALMSYTKSKNNNSLFGRMEPLKGYIHCRGGVWFKLDEDSTAQTIASGHYSCNGDISVKPGQGESGSPFYFTGILDKTNTKCTITLAPTPQKMIAGKNVINVLDGETHVDGQTWSYLIYHGDTKSISGIDTSSNTLTFVVKGMIDVNSSSISVKNIKTPLGSMSLVYNFDESSLTGSLQMDNVNMGFASVSGGMWVRFDGNGYYMSVQGDINLGATGGYAGGFIIGNTSHVLPEHSAPLLDNFMSSYRTPFANGGGLTGFYAIGQRTIVDKSFNLLLSVSAKGGLGAYITADFKSSYYNIGGYGFARFKTGVDIGLCCFCICQGALFEIQGKYDNGNFAIASCATASFDWDLCLKDLSADFSMKVGYDNGFTLSIRTGSCEGSSVPGPCR